MMDNYGCQNIADALAIVPGIYITDDYTLAQIGIRGVAVGGDWNQHVMVLLDGRPLNEQYVGTSSIDLPGIDIDNLERIEVIKGPASSLYGSNAFLGMINLITAQPEEDMLAVSGKYGSAIDTKGSSLRFYRQVNDELSIFATGSYFNQGGSELFFEEYSVLGDGTMLSLDDDGLNQYYLDMASFSEGWARGNNLQRKISTHNRIDWKDFSLTLHYSQLKTGVAYSMWGSLFDNPGNRFKEIYNCADLGYSSQITESVEMTARLSYSHYEWSDQVLYNYASWEAEPDYLPGPYWKDWEYNRSVASEVRLFMNLGEQNKLTLGGETQLHRIKHASGETLVDGETIIENAIPEEFAKYDGQIYNVYAQDEHRFSDKLKFVSGLHFNYYTYTTGKVMPKLAMIVNPYKGTTFKAIASRGFRSPSFHEIAYTDGTTYLNNSDLNLELITNYELLVSQDLDYGLAVEAAYSHADIRDMIQLVTVTDADPGHPGGDFLSEVQQFQNVNRHEQSSVEFGIRRSPLYRFSGYANVTWQDLCEKYNDDPDKLHYNSPRWLGNFGLTYQLVEDKWSLSARTNYMASRALWDGTMLDERYITDIILNAHRLWNTIDIGLGVKNVLDTEDRAPMAYDYAPSTSIERPGRSMFVRLKTDLGW